MPTPPSLHHFRLGEDLLTVFDYTVDALFHVPPENAHTLQSLPITVGERVYTLQELLWVISALPRSKRLALDDETHRTLHEYLGPGGWPAGKQQTYHHGAEALLRKICPMVESVQMQ
jgi:hypothetical protein